MARYINADELMKRWDKLSPRGRTEFDQEIMVQPTADVKENVRGEWIAFESYVGDESYKCSKCGCKALEDGIESYKSNYCPFCGADMREA